MHSKLFDTYLPEFMWRRNFGDPVAFGHIKAHCGTVPYLINVQFGMCCCHDVSMIRGDYSISKYLLITVN